MDPLVRLRQGTYAQRQNRRSSSSFDWGEEDGSLNTNPASRLVAASRGLLSEEEDSSEPSDKDDGTWGPPEKNKRQRYMGPTPQKSSPTGRTVIKRTYDGNPDLFEFTGEQAAEYEAYIREQEAYKTKSLPKGFLENTVYDQYPLLKYDMGHREDAVTKWNEFFRHMGEEQGTRLARIWMQEPEIYELQLYLENRSNGARLGHTKEGRYQEPETNARKIQEFINAHIDEIRQIDPNWE